MRIRAVLSHATPAITMALVVLASCSLDPKPAPSPPSGSSAVETTPAPAPPPVTTTPMQVFAPPERDPFAGPKSTAIVTPPPKDEIERKAKKYSLDQLKLVGIVTGEEQPRAMLVDPRGKGWIVSRGDHVGRPDLRDDRFAGWRVHRIRSEEIVFVRDDGDTSEASMRTLALHAAATSDVDD